MNVTYLTEHKPAPEHYFPQDSELYFPTWERPCFFQGKDMGTYYNDTDHKHIVRMHNGSPISLGVVGKNYKKIDNKELFQGIEQTFIESFTHEQLRNVTVKDRTSYLGGMCIRQYIFPSITADIGSKLSDVAFRSIAINGYDGTSSFKFYNGAIDFFCENGMVTGTYDMMVKRHTAGLKIPTLLKKVENSIDIFYKQADTWRKWVGKEITDEDATSCFEAMPNASDKMVQKLMRQFHIECLSHGRTVWALYSAATFYATHNEGEFKVRETNQDHTASTLINREKQVRSWISTDTFQQIAA